MRIIVAPPGSGGHPVNPRIVLREALEGSSA